MVLIVALLLAALFESLPSSLAQFPPPSSTPPIIGPPPTATLPGALPPGVTPSPAPTETPPLSPVPTSNAPGCDFPFPIAIGSIITVRSGVNIRSAPSPSAPIVDYLTENRNFIAVEGPVCGSGYFWWRIVGGGLRGWVAERSTVLNFITFIDDSPIASQCAPPLALGAGEPIDLVTGVRVRETAGLGGRVLTVAPANATAVVLDAEPVCADGYNWRRIRVQVLDLIYDGYIAEGSASFEELLYIQITPDPASLCWPPLIAAIGDRGRVTGNGSIPKNLRVAPGENAEVLFTLVPNVPIEIIGGPVCFGGYNWWQVRVLSTIPAVGWLAEGPRGGYWIDIYRPGDLPRATPVNSPIAPTPAPDN
jgi:hypothetical protein